MNIEHVLLATDLSPHALRVLPVIEEMLGGRRGKLTLLHVVPVLAEHADSTLGTPLALPDYDRDRVSAEQVLEEQAKGLEGWDVTVHATTGSRVAEKIAEGAQEVDAEWIAITTHARHGLRRFVLGSVAEGVLRHAPVPVVCVAPGEEPVEPRRIRHILIPSDLSDEAMRPFGPALELARHLSARVSVVHVVPELVAIPHGAPLAPPLTPPDTGIRIEEARKELAARCEDLDERVDLSLHVIADENPARGIADFVKSKGVDLIAISTHGRTGFRRFALGSVAEEVIRNSPVPVFGFHRLEE